MAATAAAAAAGLSSFLTVQKPSTVASSCSFAAPSKRGRAARTVKCRAGEPDSGGVDRRDLLLGLGGLYGATLALNREALALPVTTPDISACQKATIPNADKALYGNNCCPPEKGLTLVDYKVPTFTKLRERPAAHSLSVKQLRDYETAIGNSKKLDRFDPMSYIQQAKIHCAYCNGAYDMVGFPDTDIQVHFSWMFLPFHRWYLYFYERILGKLCNNENFGLPFWNWDNPAGMTMPQPFINPSSPLYNLNRDQSHLPPVLVDLDNADNSNFSPEEQVEHNLWVMYRTMIAGAKAASCFHGGKYVGGSKTTPGSGTIENTHNLIHRWTGNPQNPNGEDMGSFYSSGLDPAFYCHHANVDRMWTLWQQLGGRDFTDPDWLNTSYVFYDENGKLVRVYVKDCLEMEKLGYKYEKMPILWKNRRPAKRKGVSKKRAKDTVQEAKFPLVLTVPVKTTVKVPKKTSADDEYVLVLSLSLDRTVYTKFDVYVNAEDTENLGVVPAERAGNFVNIPQTSRADNTLNTFLKLGLDELLEDVGAEQDEDVVVTIVPRSGVGKVTVRSVKMQTTCDVVAG